MNTHPKAQPRFCASVAKVLLLFALIASPDVRGSESVRIASLPAQSGVSGADGSFAPCFSGDGRFLVFVSQAHNLVTNDAPGLNLAVFVRDLAGRRTHLVSVDTSGQSGPDADANYPVISSNGQFVAFASAAGNLVSNDTNHACDVFVRDLVAGTTTLASIDTNSLAPSVRGEGSTRPLLSADGRWVFFESLASSLVTNIDGYATRDVFARNLQAGVTHLVSVNRSGTAGMNPGEDSRLFAITPDERFAAFASKAPDLVAGVATGRSELFVRDLTGGTTTWASSNVAGFAGFGADYMVLNAVLSAEGQSVVFKVATSLFTVQAAVFRHDLVSGVTEQLTAYSRSDSWPDLSADGRFVAFEAGDASAVAYDVFVRDTVAGTNLLGSVSNNPVPLSGVSHTPVLTPDGRSVTFLREQTEPGFTAILYVCDLVAGTTRIASVTADGMEAGVPAASVAALSADGQRVAFNSEWSGWVSNDLNQVNDIFLRDLSAGTTELISERHADRPELTGANLSVAGANSLSADGRWLALLSHDSNLVPSDTNGRPDIFLRDLMAGTTSILKQSPPGDTNEVSFWQTNPVSPPFLCGDGRYVAYFCVRNFGAGNAYYSGPWRGSIGWHNLQTGSILSATLDLSGTDIGAAQNPAISFDGRWVAFESASAIYDGGGYGSYSQIFARDMVAQSSFVASANRIYSSSLTLADANCTSPVFSPDAHWLLFQSRASNVSTNYLASTNLELFACGQRLVGTNYQFGPARMVSRTASAPLGYNGTVAISTNSRFVAFASVLTTNPAISQGVYVHDLLTGGTSLAASNATAPALSGDGRFVAFQTWQSSATNSVTNQIMVSDRTTGAMELISVNGAGTGTGNESSTSPLITANGRYVIFSSKANDLVASDTNGRTDIFVRDRWTSNTFAVTYSLRTDNSVASFTRQPMLGADGRTIIFNSFANDLVPGDYNDRRDVFVLRLGSPDSDRDGMDDDWEMAYFSTLARDGTGDFDGDGATDLQEFRAGTDPTNRGEVLRAMTLVSLGGGGTTVLWPVAASKSYRVQFKNDLGDVEWQDLAGTVVINSSTASIQDATTGTQNRRFYRVVVVP